MDWLPDLPFFEGIRATFGSWSATSDPDALLGALIALVVVIVFRGPLAKLVMLVFDGVFKSLKIQLSDKVKEELEAALRVVLVVAAALGMADALQLPDVFDGSLRKTLISILVIAVFAAWYRLLEPMIAVFDPKKFGHNTVDTSWLVRIGQFVVVLLAITAVLAVWEIDISNALTGVGVFGAGLAIAAQDFIRNLFAGWANMSEERFGPGDWIAVDGGVEGIISRVDVRSTTIMGFDRVPRYIPNADLSNAVILNKSRMDHRRINWTVRLVREATDAQVDHFCDALRQHMTTCGDFVSDGSMLLAVTPVALSDDAIDIMVFGFTKTVAYQEYLAIGARMITATRRALDESGTELAYPTQSIRIRR